MLSNSASFMHDRGPNEHEEIGGAGGEGAEGPSCWQWVQMCWAAMWGCCLTTVCLCCQRGRRRRWLQHQGDEQTGGEVVVSSGGVQVVPIVDPEQPPPRGSSAYMVEVATAKLRVMIPIRYTPVPVWQHYESAGGPDNSSSEGLLDEGPMVRAERARELNRRMKALMSWKVLPWSSAWVGAGPGADVLYVRNMMAPDGLGRVQVVPENSGPFAPR